MSRSTRWCGAASTCCSAGGSERSFLFSRALQRLSEAYRRHADPGGRGKIPLDQPQPVANLNLQPGDLVRVKSHEEILATINTRNNNRGLSFDDEMVPYLRRHLPGHRPGGEVSRREDRAAEVAEDAGGHFGRTSPAGHASASAECSAHGVSMAGGEKSGWSAWRKLGSATRPRSQGCLETQAKAKSLEAVQAAE